MKFDCKKGVNRPINAAINHNTILPGVMVAGVKMLSAKRVSLSFPNALFGKGNYHSGKGFF